ncbi:L-fuculose-phosphate aldolase [Pseudonocardia autotrophica]|uniref:L-fuculose phosphate aldolase n=1 Tax=Pseudonocardia autotrophica TaxID=2074 RepID=A0A1Y2N3G6_PSEAH|nr:class II aldolase/adducin family protein [Pseudonocardia autotrophica]OSY42043.1 L-fuculose phosphate aldolase [Pseudonocardia autotrophica]TDN75188.1 L-fuculose-phosphate aldolase [Pseudonocardia autotrophica]BBF99133.1 class II aldolase [Pseudonocardia autotrophica]
MTGAVPGHLLPVAERLCAAGHRLAALGLSPGSSGNLSERSGDAVVVTPTGIGLADLQPHLLSVTDAVGTHVAGARPSKEVPLHLAMYRREPDLAAVVHLHSPHVVAASCLPPFSAGSALPPATPYLVMRVGQAPLAPYAAPGSQELADGLTALPGRFTAALLAHHGSLAGGTGLDRAVDAAIELEEAARVVMLLSGSPARWLGDDAVRELTERYGTHWDLQTAG